MLLSFSLTFLSKASALGQLEQPWDVNNSKTTTGFKFSISFSIFDGCKKKQHHKK